MAGANVDLLRNAGEFFGKINAESNVRVVGFAKDALYGITAAINEQSQQVAEMTSKISDLEEELAAARAETDKKYFEDKKDAKAKDQREAVASQAAERNTRARNLALTGEIKKATSALDVLKNTLKDAIDKMTGMLKESIKSSLRNFDDFSKTMRAANISHADKIAAQAAATAAKTVSGGLAVSQSSINNMLLGISATSKSFFDRIVHSDKEEDKRRLNIMSVAKERTGLSDEEIIQLQSKFTDKQLDKFEETVLRMSKGDSSGAAAQEYFKKQLSTKEGQLALSKEDAADAILNGVKSAQKMGYYGFKESASVFNNIATNLSEGIVEGFDEGAFMQMVGLTGNKFADPTQMASALESTLKSIQETNDVSKAAELEAMLRALPQNSIPGLSEMINQISLAKNGQLNFGEPLNDKDYVEKANEDLTNNAKEGKLKHYTEKAIAGINNITGNLLGKLSVNLDELFGGDLSMENVVSKGFVTVINLLRSIRLSMVVNGFKNIVGFFKEKFFKSKEKEKKSDAKLVSDPIVDSSEKNTKSIVHAIKQLGNKLSGKSKLEKASGDASSSSDSKSKKKTVPSEASSKSSSKSQKQTTKKTPSKSSKALLGVGLGLGGIGAAAGVVGLLGSMGVFDSLKPMFEDFSKSVVPVLKTTVDTLAPSIGGILKQVAPVINDLLKSFGPVLKDVLDSLMPLAKDLLGFLINILNPLLPVIKNIIKSVVPILKDVFEILAPVLTTVVEVVSSVLQPLTDLLRPIFNALKPVLEPLLKVLVEFNPFLNVLKIVGAGVEVIAKKFGLDMDAEREKERQEAFKTEKARSDKSRERGDMLSKYSHDELIKIATSLASSNTNDDMYSEVLKSLQSGVSYTDEQLVNFIRTNTSGTNGESRILTDDEFNSLVNRSVSTNKALEDIQRNVGKSIKQDEDFQNWQKTNEEQKNLAEDSIPLFENGGVTDKPTKAIVGEAGKEVIFPLTKPEKIRDVLKLLSRDERFNLLKILLKYNTGITTEMISDAIQKSLIQKSALNNLPTSTVPGDDPDTINRILNMAGPYRDEVWRRLKYGWQGKTKDGFKQRKKWYDEALANAANQEGRELIKGTYAERALEYGVSELGKPYILRSLGKIGYVCNELVNAAIQASGFDMGKFRVHGVKATFANIKKGKYSGENYPNFRIRDDLTPETAIPGMVFFQDARKNKEGGFQPGHIGLVYYGHQKLHSSGGSADYTKEGFLPNWQTPCRGVTVTPFDNGSYVIGEFPGLFEQATGEFKLPSNSPVKFGPNEISDNLGKHENEFRAESTVKSAGLLSTSDIQEIMNDAGINGKADVAQYVEQANKLLKSTSSKEDIMTILYEIARYLKGIYSAPANRQHIVPVARPNEYTYGGSGGAR